MDRRVALPGPVGDRPAAPHRCRYRVRRPGMTGLALFAGRAAMAACRQSRCRATARSAASPRLRHRCQRSATWTAAGAPRAAPPALDNRQASRDEIELRAGELTA
jgi:hypothetical protein